MEAFGAVLAKKGAQKRRFLHRLDKTRRNAACRFLAAEFCPRMPPLSTRLRLSRRGEGRRRRRRRRRAFMSKGRGGCARALWEDR